MATLGDKASHFFRPFLYLDQNPQGCSSESDPCVQRGRRTCRSYQKEQGFSLRKKKQ